MSERKIKLRSGEEMSLIIAEPPLTQYVEIAEEGKLVNWIWPEIREELLAGQLTEWLLTPYALGQINGELVGSIAYFTPADTHDVGVIEFVQTLEKHRDKGIASALMSALIQKFTSEGGLSLMLCTNNPIAGKLYEKHGFWYSVGNGMRYLAPGAEDFDKSYLAFAGKAHIRNATWADLPRTSVLYNHHLPKWLIKDYLTQSFKDTRYESHFVKLLKRLEGGMGAYLVIENPLKRVVGAIAIERKNTYYEQHTAVMSLRICPAYFSQASELVEAMVSKARDMSIRTLQVYVADTDTDHKEILISTGFKEESRLRNQILGLDQWVDMLIYARDLGKTNLTRRGKGEYYGGRSNWHNDRILSKQ